MNFDDLKISIDSFKSAIGLAKEAKDLLPDGEKKTESPRDCRRLYFFNKHWGQVFRDHIASGELSSLGIRYGKT